MTITIVNIGDELLIGQVVNSNASTMGQLLTAAGMEVRRTVVVGDDYAAIWRAVDDALHESGAVLLTGGLGPTKDDITKRVLCDYYHCELVENEEALSNVRRLFEQRGYELTPVNRAQALVPACCEVLNNDLGTAPCMWFASNDPATGVLVSLPGVPFEMEWLMRNRVIPRLQETFSTGLILTKNILVQGIGESFLSDLIEPWELSLPADVSLAYLPVAGMTKLRLTARLPHHYPLSTFHFPLDGLYHLAGKYIVGEDCETLAELVHRTLLQRGLTLAVAESCTGGNIASQLTAQAGASAYFKGGVVAYSNEVKKNVLGVQHKTLEVYGAVSEETACEMVQGVRQRLGADVAIATTGIAGPDGGTREKPVGTVWIAVADGDGCFAQLLQHGGSRRQQNIDRATNQAFAMIIHRICQKD